MHTIAEQTASLSPKHNYVPWVVADGQHTDAINDAVTDDLFAFVCKNFKGEKAATCDQHALNKFYNPTEKVEIKKCLFSEAEIEAVNVQEKVDTQYQKFKKDKKKFEDKMDQAKKDWKDGKTVNVDIDTKKIEKKMKKGWKAWKEAFDPKFIN